MASRAPCIGILWCRDADEEDAQDPCPDRRWCLHDAPCQSDKLRQPRLLPVGAPSPPPEPDAGRLARGRVQKGRIAKSDGLSRSDGFQSKKGDFTGSPIFEVKSAVPLDDDLAMVSTKSQGAAARVLLALPPEGAELPVIADPPMTADPPLMFTPKKNKRVPSRRCPSD